MAILEIKNMTDFDSERRIEYMKNYQCKKKKNFF